MEKLSSKIIRREVSHALNDYLDESIHPVLKRIYAARYIQSKQELMRELDQLLPFNLLLNIGQAVERLYQALQHKEGILIIGDFDADGATSTALAVSALKAMGAEQVDYLVPNRFTYGYGLTPEIVELAKSKKPSLLITVDNGISSVEGVKRARELGMDVLITDHHLAGKSLPQNCIIINPNQRNDSFPSKAMAGVGVIFYVMLALRSHLVFKQWFVQNNLEVPSMASLLDLVALGTVADVVPLDKNNRILVYQGLGRIRKGASRPGIQALLQVARREAKQLSANDLGFFLAPRLNAAGRLDDMSLGINCLLAQDLTSAYHMALQLEQLNNERRELEAEMQRQAFSIVEQMHLEAKLPAGLCLYDAHWHQGIVGLVASRVKDKIYKPVIAFAEVEENSLKGSARSMPGVHIRDCLENIASQHPEILSKFGGHAMAAGLSIKKSDYKIFSQLFAEEVRRQTEVNKMVVGIDTDGELSACDLNLGLAELLEAAGPWGSGFPEPVFEGIFEVVDQRLVGQKHLKLLLKLPISTEYHDAIVFNINPEHWPNHRAQRIHCVYKLEVNEYQNRRRLQLLIQELEAV